MRFGLVIYGSLENLSGGYLYDRNLVAYLRSQGDAVEVISLPWQNYPQHLGHNFLPELRRRLAGLQVDVLLQDELNHPSLFVLNGWLRPRVRYALVSIVHHLRSSERHPRPLLWLYRRVEQAYLRRVDGFIFNSLTTRQTVQKLRPGPLSGVIAYPAGDRFKERLGLEQITARAHAPGPLRLLFVGNLIPRKGFGLLVQALRRLPPSAWQLQVAGRLDADPQYARRVFQWVQAAGLAPRVQFLGPLRVEQLAQAYRHNQVLVVPSSYEGFGIVYLEAMGFGLVPVATTRGAAGEIITPGENGFLVAPEQPEALAVVLERLLRDRDTLAVLSLAAWRRFDEFPTWQESAAAARHYLIQEIERKAP